MKYFDTHSHFFESPIIENFDEVVKECKENGILVNNVGTNLETSLKVVEQSKNVSNMFCSIGVHPTSIEDKNEKEIFEKFDLLLKEHKKNKIIAIGETGLDYFHNPNDKEIQKKFFLKHIELAIKHNMPLILHVRDAHEDAIEIITTHIPKYINVVVHCFDSSVEMAKKYTERGCFLGIGGLITHDKKIELHNSIKDVNPDLLLSETDCPYLTPRKFVGQRNKPLFMLESIRKMSEIMNMDFDVLSKKLFENAMKFFTPKINREKS
jgi:TatD DNase family protein